VKETGFYPMFNRVSAISKKVLIFEKWKNFLSYKEFDGARWADATE